MFCPGEKLGNINFFAIVFQSYLEKRRSNGHTICPITPKTGKNGNTPICVPNTKFSVSHAESERLPFFAKTGRIEPNRTEEALSNPPLVARF